MRISELDRSIIAVSELEGRISVEELRKRVGAKAHRVRYSLKKLEERGIIAAPRPLVDLHRLGMTCYTIYFSLAAESSKQKEKLIDRFVNTARVSWVMELGADFHYGISIWAYDLTEVLSLLRRVSSRYGRIFFQKSLNIRISFTLLGKRYFATQFPPPKPLSMQVTDERSQADETDIRILRGLANEQYRSDTELAKLLDIPLATFERRKQKLEREEVIVGYFRRIYSERIGMQQFKLLIYLGGFDPRMSKRLRAFLENYPNAVYFVESIGAWDYEIGVEGQSTEEVVRMSRDLYDSFSGEVSTIKVIPVFGYRKFKRFPA